MIKPNKERLWRTQVNLYRAYHQVLQVLSSLEDQGKLLRLEAEFGGCASVLFFCCAGGLGLEGSWLGYSFIGVSGSMSAGFWACGLSNI